MLSQCFWKCSCNLCNEQEKEATKSVKFLYRVGCGCGSSHGDIRHPVLYLLRKFYDLRAVHKLRHASFGNFRPPPFPSSR